jgi:hypothetical protein
MKELKPHDWSVVKSLASAGASVLLASACGGNDHSTDQAQAAVPDARLLAEGQAIFRFDTFGDESQWTDTLRMHDAANKSNADLPANEEPAGRSAAARAYQAGEHCSLPWH